MKQRTQTSNIVAGCRAGFVASTHSLNVQRDMNKKYCPLLRHDIKRKNVKTLGRVQLANLKKYIPTHMPHANYWNG